MGVCGLLVYNPGILIEAAMVLLFAGVLITDMQTAEANRGGKVRPEASKK